MKLKKLYSFLTLLTAFLWLGSGTMWGQDECTVGNTGTTTTSRYVPVYGYYCDYLTHSQIIYDKSLLSDMANGTITGITFYSTSATQSWGSAKFTVKIAKVDASSLSALNTAASFTTVVASSAASVSSNKLQFTFDAGKEFAYDGTQNLLVDIELTTKGSASSSSSPVYEGITTASNVSYEYHQYNSSIGQSAYAFLPKTTFIYEGAATCSKPKNVHFTDLKSTSASFAWTKGDSETSWQYICLPAATAIDWSDVAVQTTTSTSATINGLSAETNYKFYVRAYCSGSDQSKDVIKAFKTPCTGEVLPWDQNFDEMATGSYSSAAPACWDMLNANAGNYPYIYVSTSYAKSGKGIYFVSSKDKYGYIVLPAFASPTNNLKASFWYKNEGTSSSNGQITIGYMTDVTDESTFIPVETCTRTTTYTQKQNILFTSAPSFARIAFRYGGGSDNFYAGIDNVLIESTQDCSKPATPTYTDLTGSSVTLSWAANAGVTDYKYINVDRTANPTYVLDWTNDATAISATSVDLTSLTDGHNYEFYVMCACGTVASDACEYTPLSCPTVTSVTLSNQVWDGVTVNWTTSATTNCDVQYKIGEGVWTEYESNISATSKSFSGLVPGTEYSFRVKPHCSADGWVSPALPYTPVCPTPGALTFSNQTYNGVTVSWDEIVGVGTWNLEYQQGDLGWGPVPENPLTTPTYTFSGLETDVEYSFRVQAGCEGAWSPIATYTPVYAAPTDVLVSVQDLGGDASWAPVTGATGYQYIVVLKDAAQDWSSPATGTTVSSGYVHADPILSGLHAKTAYDFYVKAVFAGGTSSATKKSFTTSSHAPNTPTVADGDITSSSAVATWTLPAACQATRCQWICKLTSAGTPADDDAAWSTPTTEFTANISGLDAYTDYTVYVRAYYEDGIYSSNATKAFKTDCGTVGLPLAKQTFSSSIPACWASSYTGNEWGYEYYGTYHSAYYSAQYLANTATTNSADLKTPTISVTDKATLTFWYRNYYYKSYVTYYATGEVLFDDGESETKLWDIDQTTSSMVQKNIDLSNFNLVGKTGRFIFRGHGAGTSSYARIWIDDVEITINPISAPTNLAAAPTADGADVTWDAEEGPYDLQYRVNGSSDAWTAVNGIATKTKTLTGLTLGTEYEVQVRAHASEHRISAWTTSQTFIPAVCPAVETVTLSAKTYNSVTVNWTTISPTNCDVQYQAEGAAAWTSAATDLEATSKNIIGLSVGTKYYFQVKPNCSADGWAAAGETYTPAYGKPETASATGATDVAASASWSAVADAPNGYEYIVVARDAAEDWTSPTATNETSASLTGLNAGTEYDFYVRAVYGTNHGAETKAQFATIKIAPQNLQQEGESTTNSATFTWEANGAATKYQWSTDNSTWSEPITALTATAEGLTPGSSYTFYVRSYYAENVYSSAISLPFQTQCAVRNLEFSENFNAGVVPACWNADNKTSYGWQTYNYTDETGSYCLRYNASGNSGYYEQLATPSIYLSEKATLKFVRKTTTTSPEFKVLISKDGGTNKEEIGSYSARTTKKTDSIVIADEYIGETVIFYFQGKSSKTSSRYVYLDDVQVVYKYISAPTNLAVSATTDGAVVTWTDDAEDGPWDLQYRVNGSSDAWTAVNSIAVKTYTLTGLTEQEYEVQVRTHASEHRISSWTASETFTPQCPNVTGVTFADETYNSVTVNWTADGEATWSLRYKTDGDWTTINNIDTKTYGLTGLTTGETYTVAVKASCKDEAGWVAAATTYTPQYGVPTNVTISAIKDVTATLAWDAAAGATGYQYIVLEGDVAADWTAPQSTVELSIDLSGLSAATTYSVYVRAAYGLNFGEATAKETFTTITYAPTGLAETAHAETSASFSWNHNAEGAATRYEYVALDGTDTPTGSTAWTLLDNNVTVATVEGLNPGAAYTFYVRSVYANDAKSDYASLAFSTECAVRNMPFSEDFESGVSPLCWSAMNGTTDYYDYDGSYGWKVKTGDASYVMRYTSGTGIIYPALVMPQINIEANAQLSFKVRNVVSSKTVNGKVVVSAEGVADLETTLTNSNSLTEQQIDLSAFAGKVATIKFVPTSNMSGGRIDLDDVRVFRGVTLVDNVNNTATLAGLVGQTLEVALGRTIYCDGDYNTICLPFDLPTLDGTPLAGGELWSFRYGEVVGGELQIRIAPATSIEAGVPYLITFANGADIVNPTFTDVTITKSVGVSVGQTDDVQFIGILKPQAFVEEDKNNLFVASNGMLAWSNVGTGTALSNLRSFRGYFHTETAVSGTPVSNHMPARIVRGEQVATGIDDVHGDVQSLKLLENGRVVIIRNGVKYSVQGQVISK